MAYIAKLTLTADTVKTSPGQIFHGLVLTHHENMHACYYLFKKYIFLYMIIVIPKFKCNVIFYILFKRFSGTVPFNKCVICKLHFGIRFVAS